MWAIYRKELNHWTMVSGPYHRFAYAIRAMSRKQANVEGARFDPLDREQGTIIWPDGTVLKVLATSSAAANR